MKINDIVNHLGIMVDYDSDPKLNCIWNGMKFSAKGMPNDYLFHELGHWIASSEERRLLPDFALGPGPSTTINVYNRIFKTSAETFGIEPMPDNKMPDVFGDDEEVYACIIEFCLEVLCDMDVKSIMRERNFLRYNSNSYLNHWEYNDFYKHVNHLVRNKILTRDWIPTVIKGIVSTEGKKKLKKFKEECKMIRG